MPVHSRRFVVLSGLPGSGKSTLAHRMAPLLALPVIDKDDILVRLFEQSGTGDSAWRRQLSRQSDRLFEGAAGNSAGALLVSFWRVPGMPESSGTPTGWIPDLSAALIHVHCDCPPEVAASRFQSRLRHAGHGDAVRPLAELLASFRELERFGPPSITPRIDVDTSGEVDLEDVMRRVWALFSLE